MTKRGYVQTQEHKDKIRAKKLGSLNPMWKGDLANDYSGRERARRAYKDIGPCRICGNPKSERHHKDGNTKNNASGNIDILCRKCHMESDGRIKIWQDRNYSRNQHKVKLSMYEVWNRSSKVKTEDIPKVFAMYANGMLQREIGAIFGVKQAAISRILLGGRKIDPDAK